MAKVYAVPEGFEAPDFDYRGDWQKQENDYIERLRAECFRVMELEGRNNSSKAIGEIVDFPIADGCALYMVWNSRPLELVHIATGDAYSIPMAHARGLRMTDINQNIQRRKSLSAMFGGRAKLGPLI